MGKYILLLLILIAHYSKAQVQKIVLPEIYQTKSVKVSVKVPSNKTFNLDVKQPKSKTQLVGNSTLTSNTAIYKSNSLPVYQTKTGRLFVIYPNKDNTGYNKKYINPDLYESEK